MPDVQTPEQGTEEKDLTTPEVGQEPETPQTPPVEETPQGTETETPAQPQPEPQQPQTVSKDKFVASQRESILNAARVQAANERIEQLTKQDTPTDEAMRALYPEWDQLDEYNKRVLIRQETIAMQNARTLNQQQDILARQQLDDKLNDFLETPPEEFKKLIGKESEFRRFAKRKNNIGLPLETLAKAFLFDVEDEAPQAPSQPMTEALPAGSGGPREPLKPKKISLEEAREIRKTDSKRYKELVMSGQIEELE